MKDESSQLTTKMNLHLLQTSQDIYIVQRKIDSQTEKYVERKTETEITNGRRERRERGRYRREL